VTTPYPEPLLPHDGEVVSPGGFLGGPAEPGWIATQRERGCRVGRVVVVSRGFDTVRYEDGTEELTDRSTAAFRAAALDGPPAVGDWVGVVRDGSSPAIVAVAPRRGVIVRRDPADRLTAQVVAANVDTVLCVFGLDRPLRPRRVERVLVLVHEGGASPVVVLTKGDLDDLAPDRPETATALIHRLAPSVPVHVVSSRTGAGLDGLAAYLGSGSTVALLGESGAGKSSLVNALVGTSEAEVGTVRDRDRRGRHTTTVRRLFALPGGASLIDTPGLRSLGLWDAADGVDEAFPDVAGHAEGCRFRDCRHEDEPDCAVRAAAEAGALPPARLTAYRSLRAEVDLVEIRREAGRRRRGEGRRPPLRRARRRADVDHDEDDSDDTGGGDRY